ncbi:MAG: hypothetical protein R3E97_14370 [Candidatus Eisenbacteria bacterium]
MEADRGPLPRRARDGQEDEDLDPATIVWTTEQGRRAYGAQLPAALLVPGANRIERPRRTRRRTCETEARRLDSRVQLRGSGFRAGRGPRSQRALSALDLPRLGQLLDPGFVLRACGEDGALTAPDPLSRTEFLAALGQLSNDPELDRLEWGGVLVLQGDEARSWAVVRWRQLGIESRRDGLSWRTVGLSAELILTKVGPDWRVVTWREVDRGDGPGVPTLLRTNRL